MILCKGEKCLMAGGCAFARYKPHYLNCVQHYADKLCKDRELFISTDVFRMKNGRISRRSFTDKRYF